MINSVKAYQSEFMKKLCLTEKEALMYDLMFIKKLFNKNLENFGVRDKYIISDVMREEYAKKLIADCEKILEISERLLEITCLESEVK